MKAGNTDTLNHELAERYAKGAHDGFFMMADLVNSMLNDNTITDSEKVAVMKVTLNKEYLETSWNRIMGNWGK